MEFLWSCNAQTGNEIRVSSMQVEPVAWMPSLKMYFSNERKILMRLDPDDCQKLMDN